MTPNLDALLNPLASLTDEQLINRAVGAFQAYKMSGEDPRYFKGVVRYEEECQKETRPAGLWLRVLLRVKQEEEERDRLNRANVENLKSAFVNNDKP
jgi:hypothetical protein